MDILWIDGPIVGYVKIYLDPLGCPQGVVLAHFGPKKWRFFINIMRILWLVDSPKDLDFGKILVSGNILRFTFSGGKWSPKMDQNCTFCVRSV